MNKKSIQSLEEMKKLLEEEILHQSGNIVINLAGIPKVSKSNDIIGNCLQEWLPQWFQDNHLNLESNRYTQTFPDFIAHFDKEGKKDEMIDIKCWNYKNNPAFDIANFDSFYNVMYKNPSKIFAKYLTIGYEPIEHGFKIDYVGLHDLWEILGETKKYPLNVQVKRGRPYAIRPVNFVKNPKSAFKDSYKVLDAVKKFREKFPSDVVDYTPDEWLKKTKSYLDGNLNKECK